jgi:hypothetical protein
MAIYEAFGDISIHERIAGHHRQFEDEEQSQQHRQGRDEEPPAMPVNEGEHDSIYQKQGGTVESWNVLKAASALPRLIDGAGCGPYDKTSGIAKQQT